MLQIFRRSCRLFHTRCHFLGNGRHILGAVIEGANQLMDFLCHGHALVSFHQHFRQHSPQGFLHLLQGLDHNSHLVLAVSQLTGNFLGEVPICYSVELVHRLLQRGGNITSNNGGGTNAHQKA